MRSKTYMSKINLQSGILTVENRRSREKKRICSEVSVNVVSATDSALRQTGSWLVVEVCMGMGKTGIPRDSHGMGVRSAMGWEWELKCMGMGVKTWELSPATVNSLLFLHSNME